MKNKNFIQNKLTKNEAENILKDIRKSSKSSRKHIYRFWERSGHLALNYKNFGECMAKQLKNHISKSQVYRELSAAKFEVNVGRSIGIVPEKTLRPVTKYEEGEQIKIWKKYLLKRKNIKNKGVSNKALLEKVTKNLFPDNFESDNKTKTSKTEVEKFKEKIIKELSSKNIRKLIRKLKTHLENV